jgi:thiamine biosynthesis lipoprotein
MSGCSEKTKIKKHTRFYMNTYITISVPETTEESIIEETFSLIYRLDKLITDNRGKSEVDMRLLSVVEQAIRIAKITKGKFDPTIYPVTNAWGMYNSDWRVPKRRALKKALKKVDWKKIEISGLEIKVPENMGLDFGGVGKGWVIDSAVEFLKSRDVEEGIVDAGGDLRVWGDRKWKIGIRNPFGKGLAGIIKLKEKAIATSGDYENYFTQNEDRYHHIIDPDTGYPAVTKAKSASVIANTCAKADGAATGLFMLGYSGILRIEKANMQCVIIEDEARFNSKNIDIEWIKNDKK